MRVFKIWKDVSAELSDAISMGRTCMRAEAFCRSLVRREHFVHNEASTTSTVVTVALLPDAMELWQMVGCKLAKQPENISRQPS